MGVLGGAAFEPGLLDPEEQIRLRSCVCAIEIGDGTYGTGFLIGPDLVLTNWHVIKDLIGASPMAVKAALCRFDYVDLAGFRTPNKGNTFSFADDWNVAFSPLALDVQGHATVFRPDALDYAIVRLGARAAELRIPYSVTHPMRGWIAVDHPVEPIIEGSPVLVMQYPQKSGPPATGSPQQPLEAGCGRVVAPIDELWVRHTAPTLPGSSGSPCFDRNSNRLIAVHHASVTTANQAVTVTAIIADVMRKGQQAILEASRRWHVADAALEAQRARADCRMRYIGAAKLLMDREQPEAQLLALAGKAGDKTRAWVHAVVCDDQDEPLVFRERLASLSLPRLSNPASASVDRLPSIIKILELNSGVAAWPICTLTWPDPGDDLDYAKAGLAYQFAEDVEPNLAKGSILVCCEVTITDDRDPQVELELITHLASLCARHSPDQLQAIVSFEELSTAPSSDRRRELAALWKLKTAPPGCGVCITFDAVAPSQLNSWRGWLSSAWKVDESALKRTLEQIFSNAGRIPKLKFRDLFQRLESNLEMYVDNLLDKAQPLPFGGR